MQKDVLIQGINSETGQPIICVVNERIDVASPESQRFDHLISGNVLLSLHTRPFGNGVMTVTNEGMEILPELKRASRRFISGFKERIGEGGEGWVWKAYTSDSNRLEEGQTSRLHVSNPIAIAKRVRKPDHMKNKGKSQEDRLITMEALRHFVATTSELAHVRVPKQYGFVTLQTPGPDPYPITWVAMEYVPGETIGLIHYEPQRLLGKNVTFEQIETDLYTVEKMIEANFNNGVATTSDRIHPDDLHDYIVPDDDQKHRNILVDLDTPSATRPYTLWVLDQ